MCKPPDTLFLADCWARMTFEMVPSELMVS